MMCREVVEATTDASEGALSGWRKVSYRFHLTICPYCRAHKKQVDTTLGTLKVLPSPKADEDARARALEAFRRKQSL